MRCKICGAELRKEGDICTNCYKLYQEEEDLKNDSNERLILKRKYSIGYNLVKYWWIFAIFVLSSIVCLSGGEVLPVLGLVLGLVLIIGFLLFLDKRLAVGTRAKFYDTKVIYTFNFLFFNTVKVVKYSDITDVAIYPSSIWQKKYNLGDICVYAKGSIFGANLLNGFQIKNVENVEEVLEEIGNIIGPLEDK